MSSSLWALIFILALATFLGVINGWNDAANAIATVIGTRSLSPRTAVIMAAVLNFVGTAAGLEVAKTIGKGIIVPEAVSYEVAIAGLLSIILWGTYATYLGLPISLTHGFISGLAGAGMGFLGARAVNWGVMVPILLTVVIAPLSGFIVGYIVMVGLYWLFRKSTPAGVQTLFSKLEILSSAFAAYTHGVMDGQYGVGVMVMALVLYTGDTGLWEHVPWWVIALSASAISYGTAAGGWKVIKTLGMKVADLRPVNGFAAEFAAATVVGIASLLGIPTSTTHCISAAIMGVGATKRLSAVRWGVAGHIVAAWLITFPICGVLGFIFAWLMKLIF